MDTTPDPGRVDTPPPELQGLKYFEFLHRLLASLRPVGDHPNRKLYYDDAVLWLILAFFNASITSLRSLQRTSEAEETQRRFDLPRFSLGSFSESAHIFDADLLAGLFRQLAEELSGVTAPAEFKGLPAGLQVLAGDASVWKLLPRMFYSEELTRCRKGELKGHFLYEVLSGVPVDVTITDGKTDERAVLARQLKAGVLYILDRGYLSVNLYRAIVAAEAHFVARVKEDCRWEVLEERPLTEADRAAGVTQDQVVRWHGETYRLVVARRRIAPPANLHPRRKNGKQRAGPRGAAGEQVWHLLTDRFDLSAAEVAALYAYRWQIEIFFRWLKCTLRCRHLFLEQENGFALQIYAALLATLVMIRYTGRKPCKALLEVIMLYLQGWANEADVQRVVAKCPPLSG